MCNDSTNNFEVDSVIAALNRSDFKFSKILLEADLKFRIEGEPEIARSVGNSQLTKTQLYRLYRYLDAMTVYSADLLYEVLKKIYLNDGLKNDPSSNFIKLIEVEAKYVSVLSRDTYVTKVVEVLSETQSIDCFGLRLQFLIGKLKWIARDFDGAKAKFAPLVSAHYYEYLAMTMIGKSFVELNLDSVSIYAAEIEKKFPKFCNIPKLFENSTLAEPENYIRERDECKCVSKRDSLYLQVSDIRYLLATRNFARVKKEFERFDNLKDQEWGEFYQWVRGEMYDAFLKTLYNQGKYKDLENFVKDRVGLNSKINIKNQDDFTKLIFRYWHEYTMDKTKSFESFYEDHFVDFSLL